MKNFFRTLLCGALFFAVAGPALGRTEAEQKMIELLNAIYEQGGAGGGGGGGGLTDAELRAAAVPVSMAAVPVGAATAAAQATAQATLATIATNTTIPPLTRFRNTAVTNTAVAVKASAGNVHGWNIINPNTVPSYVKFYDIAAGSVTVGTSTVLLTLAIPANGAFFVRSEMVPQQSFTTAIAVAAVSGLADNSAAAPSSAVHVSVQYQ